MRVQVRTVSWAIVLAAGVLATAQPGRAQVVTFTPFPIITGTSFNVMPGPHIGFSFNSYHQTGPNFYVGTSLNGWVPFPSLGGGYGGGMLGGGGGLAGGQGGYGAGQGGLADGTDRSAARQRAAKKPASEAKPKQVDSRKDEGRLAGALLARLVRVEDDDVIIAVNSKTSLAGREAWVDIPTNGPKLAASRPMYHLGAVTEPGSDRDTYRVHIEHKADDPGLVDAMPIWLLLPPGEVATARRP